MLGAALSAGLSSAGVDATTLAVVPTPTVSFVARTQGFGLGVVISASHNPAPDNGIKLLDRDGRKLSDEAEAAIEELIGKPLEDRPAGGDVGALESGRERIDAYLEFLKGLVPEGLSGMKVAVDAADGAAYELAPALLRDLGAEVSACGVGPDGMNINARGGATKPQTIQDFTVASGADIGVAFDGDADRAVFSDEQGRLLNGDRTIGLWGAHWHGTERMPKPIAVGTVMSNGGFERYLIEQGVELRRVKVGDKYVSQELDATGARIGGEQSGHIIFPELGPTGDGLATMLEVLRVLRREGGPASRFYEAYEPWPQLLVNVTIADRAGWEETPGVTEAIAEAERRLAGQGRLSVRASGTQPMLRVMVEASRQDLRDETADALLGELMTRLGGEIYSRVDLTHALGD